MEEWAQVEALVLIFQKQFGKEELTREEKIVADSAAESLIQRFNPLFKKYTNIIKTGIFNWDDHESKQFVLSFIDDPALKRALKRKKQSTKYRVPIYAKFNFIKETYGTLSEDEILIDMQVILLDLARRYKKMGRSFCAYVFYCFRHEVSRHIKKFTRNVANIPYRKVAYEEYMAGCEDNVTTEDDCYENNTGIPDMFWINGQNCSDLFADLTPLERKILVKYYIEDWNDRQIADEYGLHINTINHKRRCAIISVANRYGIDPDLIQRNRKSGKKANIPAKVA